MRYATMNCILIQVAVESYTFDQRGENPYRIPLLDRY